LAALIRKQHDPSPEFLSMRAIIAATVDIVQSRPQSEGLAPVDTVLTCLVAPLMELLLPILSLQLDLPNQNRDLQKSTASAVLGLATTSPAIFKDVLGRMDVDGRDRLEVGLRTALEEKRETVSETVVKPSISLKLDFGSID
jgi:hypothetical protein